MNARDIVIDHEVMEPCQKAIEAKMSTHHMAPSLAQMRCGHPPACSFCDKELSTPKRRLEKDKLENPVIYEPPQVGEEFGINEPLGTWRDLRADTIGDIVQFRDEQGFWYVRGATTKETWRLSAYKVRIYGEWRWEALGMVIR